MRETRSGFCRSTDSRCRAKRSKKWGKAYNESNTDPVMMAENLSELDEDGSEDDPVIHERDPPGDLFRHSSLGMWVHHSERSPN